MKEIRYYPNCKSRRLYWFGRMWSKGRKKGTYLICAKADIGKSTFLKALVPLWEKKGLVVEQVYGYLIEEAIVNSIKYNAAGFDTNADVLIIENIESLRGKEATAHEFSNVLKKLQKEKERIIICTSNEFVNGIKAKKLVLYPTRLNRKIVKEEAKKCEAVLDNKQVASLIKKEDFTSLKGALSYIRISETSGK